MKVFEMIVIIVIASLIAGLIKQFLEYKKSNNKQLTNIDERLAKIENLEQRIQVLEKIVTDKNFNLKRQLNDLE